MNIPFKRRELQVECEKIARIQQGLPPNSNDFVFKNLLEVTNSDIAVLKDCQSHDSVSFYFNAIYSFLQGLKSLCSKSFSWATVQLYYSVFFSCKAILGFHDVGILRKKGLCRIDLRIGERAKKLAQDNDHKQTIKCFCDTFPNAFVLSNLIVDQNFFEWIQDAREITNYRQQVFQEPHTLDFLTSILERIKVGETLKQILNRFSADWSLYCFQEESALIAGSYKLLVDAYNHYALQNEKLSGQQKQEISKIIRELGIENLDIPISD